MAEEYNQGGRFAIFTESFFKQLLDMPNIPSTDVVERAHRVPTGNRL